jgi:hypothetical protein
MSAIPSPSEYYSEVLKANGFVPPADEIEKFAAAQKIDVETAKLARAFFEQLQLDGVQYENAAAMFDDSIKIASGYLELVATKTAEAEKLAGDLHRAALVAMESFLAHNRIELDANEAVKIAGLQAASFQELTRREAQSRQLESEEASKAAAARALTLPLDSNVEKAVMWSNAKPASAGKIGATPAAATPTPVTNPYMSKLPETRVEDASTLNKNHLAEALANHYGDPASAPDIHEAIENHLKAKVAPDQHADFRHMLYQNIKASPGIGIRDALHATTEGTGAAQARLQQANAGHAGSAPAGGGKILGMNPGVATAVGGGLTLGAAYLLKKHMDAKNKETSAADNRQQALVHGAALPEAM